MSFKIINKKIGRNSKNINYLGKDFVDFRANLLEYAKTYFPNTYSDFNESSPGMMFIEMASYVGDVLSYYTDSSLKETFVQFASDPVNLFALANMLGYKPKLTSPAITTLSVYQLCKADATGELDAKYLLRVKEGLEVTDERGVVSFRTIEDLDFFDKNEREVSVYSLDTITNKPDYLLVKKKIKAISATVQERTFTIESPEEFLSLNLDDQNIISIESIYDSNGNRWYEVPYLGQEMVFIDYPNISEYDPDLYQFRDSVPFILKLIKTNKRFITRINEDYTISIQFGAGASSLSDELIIPTLKNVGLGLNNSISRLEESYDPTNFLKTKSYGEAPANTILTVKYLIGGGITSNVPSNSLNKISTIQFDDTLAEITANVDSEVYSFVKRSIVVENEIPATGGRGVESIEEIREGILSNFSSQNRAVTAKDYQIRSLAMPTKYGSIAKAYAIADNTLSANSLKGILNSTDNLEEFTNLIKTIIETNSDPASLSSNEIKEKIRNFSNKNSQNAENVNPFAINLYLLGFDNNGNYTPLNRAVKENLKTYISEYRMLTDGINIIDGFIINIGVEFEISVYKNYNYREILLACIDELKKYFSYENWQFNQPIYISDVEVLLATIEGVASVHNVKITNKCGGNYSHNSYNIDAATKNKIIYPSLDPAIFEIKFPDTDIKGKII